ncbi:MAG TPA: hypothetical protein VME46_20180 [Acidimicrobiales bacterium]|nr:hypothetical protein [Acidimicrobiales bacterium]
MPAETLSVPCGLRYVLDGLALLVLHVTLRRERLTGLLSSGSDMVA